MRDLEAGPSPNYLTNHTDTVDPEVGHDQGHCKDLTDTVDLEVGHDQGHYKDLTDTVDLEADHDQGHCKDLTDKVDLEAGHDQELSVDISSLIPIPESLIAPKGETPTIILPGGTTLLGRDHGGDSPEAGMGIPCRLEEEGHNGVF